MLCTMEEFLWLNTRTAESLVMYVQQDMVMSPWEELLKIKNLFIIMLFKTQETFFAFPSSYRSVIWDKELWQREPQCGKKRGKSLDYFDCQNVSSLCSRHVTSTACASSVFLSSYRTVRLLARAFRTGCFLNKNVVEETFIAVTLSNNLLIECVCFTFLPS